MTSIPTVTALYGSLNAAFNIFLALRVSNLRRSEKITIGEGDSKKLLLAIRIHSNNAEFVPLAILMLLLAELCGGSSVVLHTAGGLLLLSRIAHMIGMPLPAPNVFRFFGTAVTWVGTLALCGYILYLRR